jgi:thiol-disulfide isomerase/thioredoxin
MPFLSKGFLVTVVLLSTSFLLSADTFSKIEDRIKNLRSLSDTERPKATLQLATEIRGLPASQQKLELADHLAGLVTEGDQGQETIQAVADTLRQSLAETPIREEKDQIPPQYTTLAEVVLYGGAKEQLNDPLYFRARQTLVHNDAEAAKADFTLHDLKGNKWTLSALRGKLVLVNFWATWCAPCKVEMPELDWLSTRYESQGLVVLSITLEDEAKVRQFASSQKYHPAVLIDQGGKVSKQFHIEEIPKTFVYGRDGKLIAVGIDQHTRKQFLRMLSNTDLRP